LLLVLGYALSVLGLIVTIALVTAWRSYLVALQLFSTLSLLGGYFLLSGSLLPTYVVIGFSLSFVLTGGLAILRVWLMGPLDRFSVPYFVIVALALMGLELVNLYT
jgi:hypothetical protein